MRIPVYVLFTKADTIPSFEDYFWNLNEEESRRVLGATLPLLPSGAAASYPTPSPRSYPEPLGNSIGLWP